MLEIPGEFQHLVHGSMRSGCVGYWAWLAYIFVLPFFVMLLSWLFKPRIMP